MCAPSTVAWNPAESKDWGIVDQLLRMLRIKGRATTDVLATVLEIDVAASAIEQCEEAGLIEDTRLGYRITDWGASASRSSMPASASRPRR